MVGKYLSHDWMIQVESQLVMNISGWEGGRLNPERENLGQYLSWLDDSGEESASDEHLYLGGRKAGPGEGQHESVYLSWLDDSGGESAGDEHL